MPARLYIADQQSTPRQAMHLPLPLPRRWPDGRNRSRWQRDHVIQFEESRWSPLVRFDISPQSPPH
jgi:hypothetical protein